MGRDVQVVEVDLRVKHPFVEGSVLTLDAVAHLVAVHRKDCVVARGRPQFLRVVKQSTERFQGVKPEFVELGMIRNIDLVLPAELIGVEGFLVKPPAVEA